jgi:malonyl-CoA O-methyltransferase
MALSALARFLAPRPARTLAPQAAYELWAEAYPPWAHNPLMAVEQAAVEPIVRAAKPRRALDIGTGTGRGLAILTDAGARTAVGVDLSIAMLRQRSTVSPCVCADGCRLPFRDGSFDVVSSSLMVGDVLEVGAWIHEASRVLARGGTLVYSDFHPSWAEHGWKRTFRTAAGELVEAAFHPHTIEQHLDGLERAGLELKAIREPRAPGRPSPVVAVFHACKPR